MITKGDILRQDCALYDGVSKTASRRDSTGGTIQGLRIGDAIDVLSVYGDGVNRTDNAISDAINRLDGNQGTLLLSNGIWEIDDNLTVPSTVTTIIPSGTTLNVASGKTLTFSGPIQRESDTWTSGSGTVSYTASNNILVHQSDLASTATDDGTKGFHLVYYPPLAGETGIENYEYEYGHVFRFIPLNLHAAIKDYTSTDNVGAYLQNAIDSYTNALATNVDYPDAGSGGKIKFPRGKFYLSSTDLDILVDGIELIGQGVSTRIHLAGTSQIIFGDLTTVSSPKACNVEKLMFIADSGYTGGQMLDIQVPQRFTCRDLWFTSNETTNLVTAIRSQRTQYILFDNIRSAVNGYGIHIYKPSAGPQNDAHISIENCNLFVSGTAQSGLSAPVCVELQSGVSARIYDFQIRRSLLASFTTDGLTNDLTNGLQVKNPNAISAGTINCDSVMFEQCGNLVDTTVGGTSDTTQINFRGCDFLGLAGTTTYGIEANAGNVISVEGSGFDNIDSNAINGCYPTLGGGNRASGIGGALTSNFGLTKYTVDRPFVNQNAWADDGRVTVTASSGTHAITFGNTLVTAPRVFSIAPTWNTTWWVSGISTTGVTVNFGTAPGIDSYLYYRAQVAV